MKVWAPPESSCETADVSSDEPSLPPAFAAHPYDPDPAVRDLTLVFAGQLQGHDCFPAFCAGPIGKDFL